MPPLPPNITKTGIIRTVPAWNERHFGRRDNVIRFISRRFPNKPRNDSGLPNPPLPPGTTRLAYHKGSTRPGSNFSALQWVAVANFPRSPNAGSTEPMSLALTADNQNILLSYPRDSDGGNSITRLFSYSRSQGLVKKGNDFTKGDAKGYGSQSNAGISAAIAPGGGLILLGAPNADYSGANPGAGFVWAISVDVSNPTTPPFNESTELEMYTSPVVPNAEYGASVAISQFSDTDNGWYASIGTPGYSTTPGESSFIVIKLTPQAGSPAYSQTTIGDVAGTPAAFGGPNQLGFSIDISNDIYDEDVPPNHNIYALVGAPGETSSDNSYVRIVKGIEDPPGTWSWTPQHEFGSINGEVGYSVAITDDASIIVYSDPVANTVYVHHSITGWTSFVTLPSLSGAAGTKYGFAVAIDRSASAYHLDGTTIAIGQPGYSDPCRPGCGRVLVMEYSGGQWRQVLNPIVGRSENDGFGTSLAMRTSDTILVGGAHETLGSASLYQVRNACAPNS